MRMSQYNIGCAALTKTLFEELVLNADGVDHNLFLVSPMGNIFVIGDPDLFEEIDIDENHTEFIISDAGGTERKILFHGEYSNYGILVNEVGTPASSTGIIAVDTDTDEWKDIVKWDTGQLGQELDECNDHIKDESELQ